MLKAVIGDMQANLTQIDLVEVGKLAEKLTVNVES